MIGIRTAGMSNEAPRLVEHWVARGEYGVFRRAIRWGARGLGAGIGRERLVRLGRCLEDEGRLDGPNDIRVNGEYLVLRGAVRYSDPTAGLTVFDVGANVGVWTQALADVVASVRPNLDPLARSHFRLRTCPDELGGAV